MHTNRLLYILYKKKINYTNTLSTTEVIQSKKLHWKIKIVYYHLRVTIFHFTSFLTIALVSDIINTTKVYKINLGLILDLNLGLTWPSDKKIEPLSQILNKITKSAVEKARTRFQKNNWLSTYKRNSFHIKNQAANITLNITTMISPGKISNSFVVMMLCFL